LRLYFQASTYVLEGNVDIQSAAFKRCRENCGRLAVIDNICQLDALKELIKNETAYIGLDAVGTGANRLYQWFFTFTGRRSANYSGSFNPWKDDTIGSGEDEPGSGCTSSDFFCPGFFSQDGIELRGDGIEARVLCEYTYL